MKTKPVTPYERLRLAALRYRGRVTYPKCVTLYVDDLESNQKLSEAVRVCALMGREVRLRLLDGKLVFEAVEKPGDFPLAI